jgi:hypothetical protein
VRAVVRAQTLVNGAGSTATIGQRRTVLLETTSRRRETPARASARRPMALPDKAFVPIARRRAARVIPQLDPTHSRGKIILLRAKATRLHVKTSRHGKAILRRARVSRLHAPSPGAVQVAETGAFREVEAGASREDTQDPPAGIRAEAEGVTDRTLKRD